VPVAARADIAQYMALEQGLSPQSIQSNSWNISTFLTCFGERHRSLASANLNHVDEFLAMKGANGWNRRSVSTAAQSLIPLWTSAFHGAPLSITSTMESPLGSA